MGSTTATLPRKVELPISKFCTFWKNFRFFLQKINFLHYFDVCTRNINYAYSKYKICIFLYFTTIISIFCAYFDYVEGKTRSITIYRLYFLNQNDEKRKGH